MTHFFAVTCNRFGVLARITSVVSGSGLNIETAAAYPIGGSELSVIHLRVSADRGQAERVRRKLERLVDVLEVRSDHDQQSLAVELGALTSLMALPKPVVGREA
jgi:acetolactate synthase small subunit